VEHNKIKKERNVMKKLRFLDRQAGYSLASLGLLLGTILPGVVPAFASADTLDSRSVSMSTAATGATAEYTVNFTAHGSFKSFIIDWCSDSPVIGEDTCAAPTGMDASSLGTVTVKEGATI
jgi:hypothetical protein